MIKITTPRVLKTALFLFLLYLCTWPIASSAATNQFRGVNWEIHGIIFSLE